MPINGKELAGMTDSTCIKTVATKAEIDEMIRQAKEYHFFAVNGPASYFTYLADQLKDSTVHPGFGCTRYTGADPTECKAFAAKWAIDRGAHEIDMMMNVSYLKSGLRKEFIEDVRTVKDAIGDHALKLILECPLLNAKEIELATELAIEGGADCIKTCTGLVGACTREHLEVIMKTVKGRAWVKASGGVRDLKTVDEFLSMGVARFGIGYQHAKILCELADAR